MPHCPTRSLDGLTYSWQVIGQSRNAGITYANPWPSILVKRKHNLLKTFGSVLIHLPANLIHKRTMGNLPNHSVWQICACLRCVWVMSHVTGNPFGVDGCGFWTYKCEWMKWRIDCWSAHKEHNYSHNDICGMLLNNEMKFGSQWA